MIKLQNICKDYLVGGQTLRVLDHINLSFSQGEYTSIVGPSGSGKSTLLNILGCLDRPSQGEYFLESTNVSSLDPVELARLRNREFGFIFQRFHLISRFDLVENVCLPMMFAGIPLEERRQRATEALRRVGLGHRLTHRTNEISGGESQRVAIARAIVMKPKVLLADEPTGNLDTKVGNEILKMIRELNEEGLMIFLVTHDPEAAKQAQRCVRLVDGKVDSDTQIEK